MSILNPKNLFAPAPAPKPTRKELRQQIAELIDTAVDKLKRAGEMIEKDTYLEGVDLLSISQRLGYVSQQIKEGKNDLTSKIPVKKSPNKILEKKFKQSTHHV